MASWRGLPMSKPVLRSEQRDKRDPPLPARCPYDRHRQRHGRWFTRLTLPMWWWSRPWSRR